jgi:hypothetical protein
VALNDVIRGNRIHMNLKIPILDEKSELHYYCKNLNVSAQYALISHKGNFSGLISEMTRYITKHPFIRILLWFISNANVAINVYLSNEFCFVLDTFKMLNSDKLNTCKVVLKLWCLNQFNNQFKADRVLTFPGTGFAFFLSRAGVVKFHPLVPPWYWRGVWIPIHRSSSDQWFASRPKV